jgi:hypothetical protein
MNKAIRYGNGWIEIVDFMRREGGRRERERGLSRVE